MSQSTRTQYERLLSEAGLLEWKIGRALHLGDQRRVDLLKNALRSVEQELQHHQQRRAA